MAKLKLTHFREALKKEPEAVEALGLMSYRRYLSGDFPKAIRWLLRYPRLLRALVEDAKTITPEELDELDRDAGERSRKAVEARERREAAKGRTS